MEEEGSRPRKFRILYLGALMIRKGLVYLFEALNRLSIPTDQYEVWFIGNIEEEMKGIIKMHAGKNWKFWNHIPHYELARYISVCDVAVHPSIEEGLSMVIPQMLSCGVPVIATTNTGGEEVIEDGVNGFIIPIRSPDAIKEKIEELYFNTSLLGQLKQNNIALTNHLTWVSYGDRYKKFIYDFANKANRTQVIG
jgi:glycosyltransferase involved in cell wall biosynthesis